jgi:hypothetical protein
VIFSKNFRHRAEPAQSDELAFEDGTEVLEHAIALLVLQADCRKTAVSSNL